MNPPDELYVLARRVLLDALHALGPHRDACVLVGAQAVYLRAGEGELAVAPFTTDADLALNPALLEQIPPLEQALRDAGFRPPAETSVGVWNAKQKTLASAEILVPVDLLVPASATPVATRRAARLPGHDARAARVVKGLEGVLVDADSMTLVALEREDARSFEIRVAGPAALLIAKAHKIHERAGSNRLSDKDALDVLRLLQSTETEMLATRYKRTLAEAISKDAAQGGLALLAEQFANKKAYGVEMAIRAAGALEDPEVIAGSLSLLAGDLLKALTPGR